MSVSRIPVLVWRSHDGGFTAAVAERPELAAFGTSPQDCLGQLRHALTWIQRNENWNFPYPDVAEPALTMQRVEVRPEYVIARQRHPSPPITLVMPCVHGPLGTGLLACSIPPLKLWFSYHDEAKLKELSGHYVREALHGKTPQAVATYLNATDYQLEEVLVPDARQREHKPVRRYPSLEAVAESIGERAMRKQFSRAWEREREIADFIGRVGRDKACLLLVGPPGVGKTSVLASAAREIERQIEGEQERRRFWLSNGARLIAGMPYLGQWEQRLEAVIGELASFQGVLCLENLLELVRLGGADATDSVGAFLVPYMEHRELQVVAEATPEELDACRRLLPGLADAFQILPITPFDASSSLRVLDRIAGAGARNLRVETSNDVVQLTHRLFRRFRPYDAFPGKAAGFINSLIQQAAQGEHEVTQADTLARFIDESGLPEAFLRDDLPLREQDVLGHLSSRVIGQEAACRAAAGVVTTFKAGLNDPGRPLGVLLFSGPTGVGKTELARSLSDYLFGHGQSRDRLVRLDMSEYSAHGASQRLVMDARGDASEFVKRVRSQPFCVVLLDEIEKASPDVFDMLLALFDEGRLSDRFGRVTTFQSSVLILTSNLGAGSSGGLGFGQERGPDYDAEVMRYFRPEFYNRLDAVVAFAPLGEETIRRIAEKELRELTSREGFAKAGLKLSWDDEVVALVAQAGFDRRYGARPLQRALEELVVTPLARHLAQQPETRNAAVHLRVAEGRVVLDWR